MRITRMMILMFMSLFIFCCYNGYQQFYNQIVNASAMSDVELLNEGEEPQITEIYVDDLEKQIKAILAKGYILIGYSAFNGKLQNKSFASAQAKRLKATVVLVGSKYTNTQQNTVALPMENSSTSNTSGNIYGSGIYGTYSGSSTTKGTSYIPVTINQRRFDQVAVYFVKSTKKYRFGISVIDIPVDQRAVIGRNTGAIVQLVLEGTPAFYANILEGDLIDEIDGVKVKDAKHALELMEKVPPEVKESTFKVIRKGDEKIVLIQFK